jgi:hypothetical protein
MIPRTRVVGVDFSGARNAGNKIWVAEAEVTPRGIEVVSCRQARDLPDGGADRDRALRALVAYLAEQSDAIVGFDFPFSLPSALIAETGWEGFVGAFAERYPTPEAFREDCAARSDGRELKRRTDVEARVPFAAYNLRLYRQTYWGIRDVLYPLIAGDTARVIPMQTPRPDSPVVAEICPASTLKREGLYGSYKGRGPELRQVRRQIVEQFVDRRALRWPRKSFLSRLIDDTEGDALDAVIAAIGAARVAADPEVMRPRDALDLIEARVYF